MSLLHVLVSAAAFVPQTTPDDVRPAPRPLPHFDDSRPAPKQRAAPPRVPETRPDAPPGAAAAAIPELPVSAQAHVEHTFDRVYVDRPHGADVWARGRTYKARFGGDGFDYIPFLGSDAPRNFPVRFRTRAIHFGGDELPIVPADVHVEAGAVTLQRGRVAERYHLGLEGVEQTFVFDRRAPGAIVVEIGIETDLELDASGPTPRYVHERGAVEIGAAFAVDANGARVEAPLAFDDTGYRITVPADFVRDAALPLTIDPLITTFTIDDFAAPLADPRVAKDHSRGWSAVVYTENFSSTDSDVYCMAVDSTLAVLPVGYVDLSSERWVGPAVGAAQAHDRMLVAAIVDTGVGTTGQIHGRILDMGTLQFDAPFWIDEGLNPGPMSRLSVGGDPIDRFLVVWSRQWATTDLDVHARVVTSSGTLVGSSNILLDNSSSNYLNPECSAHNGRGTNTPNTWAIVAQREVGGVWIIEAAEIEWNGIVTQTFYPIYTATRNALLPKVSSPLEQGGARIYMATFSRDFTTDYDTFAVAFSNGSVLATANLSTLGFPGSYFDNEIPTAIESNGARFALVWADGPVGSFGQTMLSTIGLLGNSVRSAEHIVLDSNGHAHSPDLVADIPDSFGWAGDYLVVHHDHGTAPNTQIRAAIYDDYAAFLGLSYCNANPNSTGVEGRIYAEGSAIAGDSLTLHAMHLPPHQFGMFVVGPTPGFVPNPGGSEGNLCITGSIGRYQSNILNAGSECRFSLSVDTGAVPTPGAPVAIQPGETWCFQAWSRDLTSSGVPTSNFTSAVRIAFN